MRKKILATCNDSGAAKAMYSVLNLLEKSGDLELITLSSGPSQNFFRSKNVKHITLEDYGIRDDPDLAKYLLEKEKPDLVFTGISELYNMERYLIYLSRINKIPSVSIIEGADYTSIRLKDSKIDPNFKFNPHKLIVVDEFTYESMLREGFEESNLYLSGHPGYDELLKLKQGFSLEDLINVKKELKIPKDSYLVIFLSQPRYHSQKQNPEEDNGYNELTVLSDLEGALADLGLPNLSLLVKIHPREDLELTKTDLRGKLKQVVLDKQYDTQRAMLSSDLVTGMFSLSLIESIYLDKDTVSLQPGLNKEDRLITNKYGLTVPVYKREEIATTLLKVIKDEKYKKELKERRSKLKLDGMATERAAKFIYSLLK